MMTIVQKVCRVQVGVDVGITIKQIGIFRLNSKVDALHSQEVWFSCYIRTYIRINSFQ